MLVGEVTDGKLTAYISQFICSQNGKKAHIRQDRLSLNA